MTQNKKPQDRKPSTPDTLVKSRKQASVELSEEYLEKVSGGVRKAGKDQGEF